MSEYIPSPQQAAVYKWVQQGRGSALVEAVAGAGKSTTLARAMGYMEGMVVALMYNKAAAEDFKAKVVEVGSASKRRYVSTCHAIALGHWQDANPRDATGKSLLIVDDAKTKKLVEARAKDFPDILRYVSFISRMVSLGKQFLMGCPDADPKTTRLRNIDNIATWRGLAYHFGADQELVEEQPIEEALAEVIRIFKASHEQCRTIIDFDDMIYAPIAYNVKFFKNDWVMIDECQDINPARRELCRRLLKNGGRLIAVGDSRQAIYGFTGAGADSLERIGKEFGCKRLPLTITYRCPKAVVAYAQQWVSHIEAHESAPDGIVRKFVPAPQREGESQEEFEARLRLKWHEAEGLRAGDAVLCRNTAPLIKAAYSMLREGRACKVEGREIGNGLKNLATKWKIKTLDALDGKLEKYLNSELAKAAARDNATQAEEARDRVESLQVFMARVRAKGLHSIDALVSEIESLFADDVKGVTVLCTGHKSKGREWHRVYWLQKSQTRPGLKDWEMVQEDNVKYVMATRAKHELVLVSEGVH